MQDRQIDWEGVAQAIASLPLAQGKMCPYEASWCKQLTCSLSPAREFSTRSTPSPHVSVLTISSKEVSRLLPMWSGSRPGHSLSRNLRLASEPHVVNTCACGCDTLSPYRALVRQRPGLAFLGNPRRELFMKEPERGLWPDICLDSARSSSEPNVAA